MSEPSVIALDAGDLGLGSGLLSLLRPALHLLPEGGELLIRSSNQATQDDLSRWCQIQHHEYLGSKSQGGTLVHTIRRGRYPCFESSGAPSISAFKGERYSTEDFCRLFPFPETAPARSGFSPRGALIEKGGPTSFFALDTKSKAVPCEVGALYDQAIRNQWSGERDIEWASLKKLPPFLDSAVSQVMTFLAENELSALYLPSRFISHVHPHFAESAMFLATQLTDEARHIEVFLKRGRWATGNLGVSAVVTAQSLLSLFEAQNFLEATFLLSVLGEGTFIDLLGFIEANAPDEVTADIARRARNDETRHVHFGMAHLRQAIAEDPGLQNRLTASVERRAASLSNVSGTPEALQDALVVLAARSQKPRDLAKGYDKYQELLNTMETNRIKRLTGIGLTSEQGAYLSKLHTPNFM